MQEENDEPALPRKGEDMRAIICFDCGQISFVPEKAFSTQCKHCGSHMSLEDITLTALSRRTRVKTQGGVYVESGARLSGVTVMCRRLVLDGWLDGPIYCLAELVVNCSGEFEYPVQAHSLRISRKIKVNFHRTLRIKTALIEGEVTGNIISEGPVIMGESGVLMGDVTAPKLVLPLGSTHKGKFRPVLPGPSRS